VSDATNLMLIVLVVLKLTGVIGWSWWWVLTPLWISLSPLVLVAGGLLALFLLWGLRWPMLRLRRLSVVYLRPPVP